MTLNGSWAQSAWLPLYAILHLSTGSACPLFRTVSGLAGLVQMCHLSADNVLRLLCAHGPTIALLSSIYYTLYGDII